MRSRTINSWRTAALAAVLLMLIAATATAQQFRVTGATLKADDRRPTGQCPVTVVFRGAITANGPGRVTYTFTRSDGAVSPVYEAEFKKAGVLRVETTWTLGDALQLPRYDGWMAVEVLSPNGLESNQATGRFTLTCAASQASGRRIVFASGRDGNYEIYSMNADGSGQTDLTLNPANDLDPRLSPDGARVVFESNRDGNYEIYSMNVDGTGLRRLTDDPAYDHAPNWSPDGGRIVFTRGSNALSDDTELYVMNADGSGLARLTNNSVFEDTPAWSPDGRSLAFASGTPGVAHIFLLDLSTGVTTQLTNDSARDSEPDWSPDGSKILFTRSTGSDDDVWVMSADGSGQTDITADASLLDDDPAWSPDGQKIVFVKGSFAEGFNVFLMKPDGSGQIQITTTNNDVHPDW